MTKIIVSDLDGTFLEKDGTVPSNAIDFLKVIQNKGFLLFFATARPLGNVKDKILKFIKPDWLICNNGSIGINLQNGDYNIMFENNIDNAIALENASLIMKKGFMPIFFMGSHYDFKVFIPDSLNQEYEQHIRMSDTNRVILKYSNIEDILKLGSIRSVSLYGDIDKKLLQSIQEKNIGMANVICYNETRFNGKTWLDISSLNADKYIISQAIAQKIGNFKIDIALGNGLNDLSLISNSVWSACPVSSDEAVRKSVSYNSKADEGKMFLIDIIKQLENKKWQV